MRESSGSEQGSKLEAQSVQRFHTGPLGAGAGGEEVLPDAAAAGRGSQQFTGVPTELRQHQHRQEDTRDQEDGRLEQLYERRAVPAADGHIDDHQDAEEDHQAVLGSLAGYAQQRCRERTGTHKLGGEVEQRDHQRGEAHGQMDGPRPQPARQRGAHRITAGVVERLCDHQQNDGPDHNGPHQIRDAVETGQRDEPRSAEKRRCGDEVAEQGDSVARGGQFAAADEEAAGGVAVRRTPQGDEDDADDEDRKTIRVVPLCAIGAEN